jgi:hypothetical protein
MGFNPWNRRTGYSSGPRRGPPIGAFSLVGPFRAAPNNWLDVRFHGLKPVEEGRHGDLPLLANRQPIRTVSGEKMWDMLRAGAWEREEAAWDGRLCPSLKYSQVWSMGKHEECPYPCPLQEGGANKLGVSSLRY